MTSAGSVTYWINQLKAGNSDAAQHLWERYFLQLVRLARKKLQGDNTGRKLAAAAEKLLDTLVKDHPDTPWEILAKREKFTALGLEWKPN